VNTRIRSINERFGIDRPTYEVLCECGHDACVQRVEVPVAVFAEVHVNDERYVVAPGHQWTGGDHVVAERTAYSIVALQPAARASLPLLRVAASVP
jgi:hypothetical protein